MSIAYIGVGSNLDNPIRQILSALQEMNCLPETHVERVSSLYKTAPVGETQQADFINAVVRLNTRLNPPDLLTQLNGIEQKHHRMRGKNQNGPRTLDLDIILYDDLKIDTAKLVIPHPRFKERTFVLMPLREIGYEIF